MENPENFDAICERCLRLLETEHDAYFTCSICGKATCAKCPPSCRCGDDGDQQIIDELLGGGVLTL